MAFDQAQLFIENRADPWLYYRKGRGYFFTASVPEYDRIVLRFSENLGDLPQAQERIIWRRHSQGPMSEHIWAPELHEIDGAWYVYFAAGQKDDIWNIRPYVLVCHGDPMTDPWEELGQMQKAEDDPYSFTDFSLDMTQFEKDGKRYAIWAQKTGGQFGISNLYIGELATPNVLATVPVMLSTPDYRWERIGFWVNEGPAVIEKNGRIFVFFSASATDANYCMGMMHCASDADVLDPQSWTKLNTPIFTSDNPWSLYGPGHNSFTKDENDRDILVFHARPYREIQGDPLYDPNRHCFLLPLKWDERGFPVI